MLDVLENDVIIIDLRDTLCKPRYAYPHLKKLSGGYKHFPPEDLLQLCERDKTAEVHLILRFLADHNILLVVNLPLLVLARILVGLFLTYYRVIKEHIIFTSSEALFDCLLGPFERLMSSQLGQEFL